MSVVGPVQPYAGGGAVQENFRDMINHVQTYNPDAPTQLIKRRLNVKLRQILDTRMWAGLLVRGQIVVPASYTTGSIDVTAGNDYVLGTDTSWPYNDLVNTTLSTEITAANEYQDITPASMDNIEAGDWLVFDDGEAGQEFILVISVGSSSFKAIPTRAHSAGVTIYKSSLARRQFRTGTTTSFYTIKGVYHSGADLYLKLDLVWGHDSYSSASYQIMKTYVSLEQNLRMVWSVVNNKQGWRIKLNLPQEVLNTYDTWRQTTGFVFMMADYVPDEIGRFQYELYPSPTYAQAFPYLAYRTVDNMTEDHHTPPPGIPSHVLVNGAISDVLLFNPKSPYYDKATAREFSNQFKADLLTAQQADDSIFMQNLQWAYSRYPFTQYGADYWQRHDVDNVFGYV